MPHFILTFAQKSFSIKHQLLCAERASCRVSGNGIRQGLTWRLQDTGDGIDHAIRGHDVRFSNGFLIDTHCIVFLGERDNNC